MQHPRSFRPAVPGKLAERGALARGLVTAAFGVPGGIWLVQAGAREGLPPLLGWIVIALGVLGVPLGTFWFLRLRRRRLAAEHQLAGYEAAIRYP